MMVDAILSHALYFGVTAVLFICGIGVPIPEELVFLAAGYMCKSQGGNVWLLCACGVVGIMLGDSIPYWAGRHWGKKLLKKRPFSWFIKPEGLAKTERFFSRYGSLTVFIGRFLAGLRMPIFFMSGSMGTPYWRFASWDVLGALISCPTSIFLAYAYGKEAEEILRRNHIYLFIGLGLMALYIVYHIYAHRPKKDEPPTETSGEESQVV